MIPPIDVGAIPERLETIEINQLYGRGYGFVDLRLLPSVSAQPNLKLWILDKSQAALAAKLGVDFRPPRHS